MKRTSVFVGLFGLFFIALFSLSVWQAKAATSYSCRTISSTLEAVVTNDGAGNTTEYQCTDLGYNYCKVDSNFGRCCPAKTTYNSDCMLVAPPKVIVQGNSTSDKKILTVGQTWTIRNGLTLTAQAIDAKASPRQAWLVLSLNGTKLDDRVVAQGKWYLYTPRTYLGKSDVNLFGVYIDSIFAGATSDIVQLRYAYISSLWPEVAACTESWSCDAWTNCSNGQRTRTCTDLNACNTTVSKPAITESCTAALSCKTISPSLESVVANTNSLITEFQCSDIGHNFCQVSSTMGRCCPAKTSLIGDCILVWPSRTIIQGQAASDKKTLTVGETWPVKGGLTFTAQAIDAKASPRQDWLVLSLNGVKLDDAVVAQGKWYLYSARTYRGDNDVNLFGVYIDSIFAGATSDMVQLRYAYISGLWQEVLGGGGGSCTENWTCGAWSNCTNSQQARSCTDLNGCGTVQSKPATTQTCDSGKPDVYIDSVTFDPQTRIATAIIKNKGTAPVVWGTNGYPVITGTWHKADGDYASSKVQDAYPANIPNNFAPGQTYTYVGTQMAVTISADAKRFWIKVDKNDIISESDETNNEWIGNLPETLKPDLAVKSINFDPVTHFPTVVIENKGGAPVVWGTTGYPVVSGTWHRADGDFASSKLADSYPANIPNNLGPGETFTYVGTTLVAAVPADAKRFWLKIDKNNIVVESDETNNEWVGSIPEGAKPDVYIDSVTFDLQTRIATAIIKNKGTASVVWGTNGYPVITGTWYGAAGDFASSRLADAYPANIPNDFAPGQTYTYIGTPMAATVPQGAATFKILVDKNNIIAETDEANNEWSGNVPPLGGDLPRQPVPTSTPALPTTIPPASTPSSSEQQLKTPSPVPSLEYKGPLPDLVIKSVEFDQNVRSMRVTIRNIGKVRAGKAKDKKVAQLSYIWKDAKGETLGSLETWVPSIGKNAVHIINFKTSNIENAIPPKGAVKVSVSIDSSDLIREMKENNNAWEGKVPLPDLKIQSVTFNKNKKIASIVIRNTGAARAGKIKDKKAAVLSYAWKGEAGENLDIGELWVPTIPPKGAYNIVIKFTSLPKVIPSLGAVKLSMKVDSTDLILESSESNNSWEGDIPAALRNKAPVIQL